VLLRRWQAAGSETILLVEDEDILRELAVRVLESLGYSVLAAEDGMEQLLLGRELAL